MTTNGVLTCARYAFAPNYYRYCGPDANNDIASYLKTGFSDLGLENYLHEFAVLYPYLNLIAQENGLSDPLDQSVVEAYWLGNSLLDKVGVSQFVDHLNYKQQLKKRIPGKKLKWLIDKVPQGAKIHHSFHVFSIFTRTGHHTVNHTLDTMDQCRIGWGKVIEISNINNKSKTRNQKSKLNNKNATNKIKKSITTNTNSTLKVRSQRLIYTKGKLMLKDNIDRTVFVPVFSNLDKEIRVGDYVSYHWGFVCDKITVSQAQNLKFYTKHNLKLANETI